LKNIPTVVFGLGRIGMLYGLEKKRIQPASHIKSILKNKNFDLIGVCDPSSKYTKKFEDEYGEICDIFDSHIKLLQFFKEHKIIPQLFVIATPENTHFKIIQDILKFFKFSMKKSIIFCEKPLTKNIENANKIKKMINNSNFELVVNHTRRWNKIWNLCNVNLKKIGKIQGANFFFSTSPENKSRNQLRDGIHIADLINWFDIKNEIHVKRLFLPYFVYDFYIWGEKGKIEVLNNGQILNLYKKVKSKRYEGFFELDLHTKTDMNNSELENAYIEFSRFLNKKNVNLSTNLIDGIEAMKTFYTQVNQK